MLKSRLIVVIRLIAFFLLVLFAQDVVSAQSSSRFKPIPNVYLDCNVCDVTYIRSNITFVNYVRDQDDADIYLTITDLRTAGGGREFTLTYRGLRDFSTRRDTLRYVSSGTDTSDERRVGLNRHIKIGLVPFVMGTVAMRNLNVFYDAPAEQDPDDEPLYDPWRGWVFDVNMRSWLNGQSTEKNLGLYSGIFAEWITEEWKIRTRLRGELNRREVELRDGVARSIRDWGEYWGLYAYSLNEHASIGLYTRANFARNSNIKSNVEASPAFEYNFYPYSEYQQRRFIIRYRITPSYRTYYQTTVLGQDSEFLVHQNLFALLRYDRPWGRVNVSLSGSNFFHDLSLNRFEFNPSLDLRIVRGFSVSFSGRYRIINDQISLPAANQSDDCFALGNCQRPTSYDYSVSFGLTYTFGSIFNNVVNPRF
ncbi:MAG: hypothetical protein EA391_05880 [Balneolaceae bacterium]|nr:MAG: hypothetical protein EA391_05880 [Balneolaceae bacterium]